MQFRFGTRMGFWSLDLGSGEVACDRLAASVFGMAGPCRCEIAQLLARFDPPGRRRVLRAWLRSARGACVFDLTACIESPRGTTAVRLIGGRGYRLGCVEPELHGVIEQLDGGGFGET